VNLAPAQRWANILLGGAVIALVVALVYKSTARPAGSAAAAVASSEAGAGAASAVPAADAAPPDLAAADAGTDPILDAIGTTGPDTRPQSGVGSRLADGSPVPPLPASAPRTARFGVILVTYAGAQGAPATARSKADAAALAATLAGDARSDFRGAVGRGDPGSSADVGRVPRGVLELAPEYALFTLAPGGVSDPVDTPRGFWIIQRIE